MKIRSMFRSILRSTNRRNVSVSRVSRANLLSGSDFFEGLEKRQLLATFNYNSGTGLLTVVTNQNSETLSIVSTSNAGNYTIATTGTWSGTSSSAVGNVSKNLFVNSTANINLIQISSNAANSGSAFYFGSSTGNFVDNLTVNFSNATSGAITVANSASFVNGSSLNLTTLGNQITVSSQTSANSTGSISLTGRNIVVTGNITTGAGNISLTGNSGIYQTGTFDGVQISGAAVNVNTTGGDITIDGRGGSTTTRAGVNLTSSKVQAGGTGCVTITGMSGNGTNSAYGVLASSATVTTISGSLTFNGTSCGTGANATGVRLQTSSNISATGAGNVTITGSTPGNLSTGVGITFFDTGSKVYSNGGLITLTANSVNLTGTVNATSGGDVLIQTLGSSVNLGTDNSINLSLSQTELNQITANLLTIGSPSTGNIDVTAAISRPANGSLALITSNTASSITVGFPLSTTGTGDISLTGRNIVVTGNITTEAGDILLTGNNGSYQTGTFDGVQISGAAANVNTTSGNITIDGRAGANTVNAGVNLTSSKVQAGGSGCVTITGMSGNGSTNNAYGIKVSGATVTANSGSLTVNGTSCGTAGKNEGVYVSSNGTITSLGSGNVTVTGYGGNGTGGNNYGIELWSNGLITSNGGAVLVTGYGGGTGTGANNTGVQIQSSTITAGGLGSVTVLGYGGNNDGTAGDTNYGVNVDSGGSGGQVGKITSSGGNVVVTGTGGGGAADSPVASSSKNNTGVFVNQGGYITAGGSGTVDVTGYGGGRSPGATGGTNYGVQVSSANSTANTAIFSYISSSGGEVSVTGFGGAGSGTTSASSGWYNHGVSVYSGGKITSGGNADVTVNGTGGGFGNSSSSSGVNSGVFVATSNIIANLGETLATITSGGNGNVTITGQGGGTTGSGANNWGVGLQAGGLVTSGGMGTVSITGVAGDSAIGNQNVGVWVQCTTTSNVSTTVTSGGGNVVVNGTGGGKNSQYNIGVVVSDGGIITAPGTASVSVTGRGGNANSTSLSATQATGVWVYGSGAKQIRPKITSTNGTVTVTGYGGNSNTSLTSGAGSNYGVQVSSGGEISSGGTAPVTVTGNGGGLSGGTSTDNVGVIVSTLGPGNLPSQITSSGGPITVTGTGGSKNPLNSGTGSSHGVSIASGGQITTTGSGTSINITGTGGGGNPNGSATNHGILIAGCATLSNFTITSNGGPITLNATEGLGSGSRGITTSANTVIGNATTSANITILTNSANLSNSTNSAFNAAGSLLIAPITPGVGVTLGCTTDSRGGPLNLSAAELNTLKTGTIQLGNSSTGNFTVSANVTVPAASNLTLLSNSTPTTGIRSNGTITMGAGKLLDVSALPSVNTQMNGTTPLTQYSQLNVTGNLSIAGRSLNLYGNYTPVSGNVFTIANATSLTGTFTGLAEASTTTFNGRTLLVNYTPTTVTLTEPTPLVTTQPTGSTVTAGTQVSFTSAATGIPTPDVQWQVQAPGGSWSNITNATSPTYSFNSASGDNGNQYRAYFTNTYGNATTSAVSVSVQFAPSITTQPSDTTINDGQTATFTAAATGNPTPTVQWQVNTGSGWADVTDGTGGTTNSYTTAALGTAQNGYKYRARYSNSITANVETNAATVTVNSGTAAPVITTQPTNQTATAGTSATFTAAASGAPTPTVQWEVSTDGTSWNAVSDGTGGTTGTYTTATLAAGDNGKQYRAVYTNGSGSVTTNVATLTVNYAPSITTQPTDQTITDGATAAFTAAATGNPAPTVQWQVNTGSGWADVTDGTGATTNSYTTAALVTAQNGYQYRARYSNSITANVETNAAKVTVNAGATAPTVTGQPATIGVEVGQTASFTASASGSPAPTAQWQVKIGSADWADITGATSATYSFTAALGDQGNQYRAVFNNTAGTATTNPAALNIGITPVFTSINYMTIPVGLKSGITVIATGTPAPQYSIISGSLPSGVTLDPVTGLFAGAPALGTAGSYPVTIQALNEIGTAPTQSFTLTVTSTVTSFVISKGAAQRSYIRYLDLGMDSNASALALLNNPGRVKLTKADLNGVGSAAVSLAGFLSVPTGQSKLAIDFGTIGLGNSRNTSTADGYYTLGVDLDGNGSFETNLFFFRLFGDTNGDKEVNATDQSAVLAGCTATYNVNLDLNGDGVVNTSDLNYVKKNVGRKLKSSLIVTS